MLFGMAATRALLIAGRGSTGVFMDVGPPDFKKFEPFSGDASKQPRAQAFSRDGKLFAYSNGEIVRVVSIPSCSLVQDLDCPKTSYLHFSPLGTVLASWELYTGNKDTPELSCNLRIWDMNSGQCLKALHQKRQIGWEPQWSDDEAIVCRSVNNEVHFYEKQCFDKIVKKIHLQKVADFKLSSGKAPYHVVCYVPGAKGQPSMIKLYQYPNFDGISSVIASKSFFKADKVDIKWNNAGYAVLVLTSTDADKSGASYYGEQKLHLLTTNGESSFVQLAKEGPVYSVEWSPLSTEFCVVYGYMPAKATLYNAKGDPTFDFGTSPRNLVYYNTFGNILILAGFGNLNGHLELWDLKTKKEIVRTHTSDTTFLEWCPDGEYFLTATLTPRLRVGNGYRIWHYTGSLIYEFSCEKNELWEVHWRPFPTGTYTENKIFYVPVPSIASSKPEASKEAYRPPTARGLPNTSRLHDDFEKASNLKQTNPTQMSKAALKNKKKRESKKAAKKEPEALDDLQPEFQNTSTHVPVETASAQVDPEIEKKTKNILKKLEAINKLKQLQSDGKQLEKNQLEKINKEYELLQELEQLEL